MAHTSGRRMTAYEEDLALHDYVDDYIIGTD
jgi:hypothetical protein